MVLETSTLTEVEVLIFVEDPGAANYVAALPAALEAHGWRVALVAEGSACSYLQALGVAVKTVPPGAEAADILALTRPRVCVTGSSENLETLGLKLNHASPAARIESVGVVDAPANAAYRFRGLSDNPLAYVPHWLLVPDEGTRQLYAALGFPLQRIVVCGHPHYDFVRAKRAALAAEGQAALKCRLLPGVLPGQKVAVFGAELSTGLNPQQFQHSAEYTLSGRGARRGRTEIVLEEFLDAVSGISPRPYLVLRLHPKNAPEEFSDYRPEFDWVSQGGSPLELLYAADLVVGMTSMLLLEAVLLGRPALAIVPRTAELAWLPIRTDLLASATTRPQLRSKLRDLLQSDTPPVTAEVALVSNSLQHVVEFIEHILKPID
jgi:hypothetical protein